MSNNSNGNETLKVYMEKTAQLIHKMKVDPDNKLWYRNSIVELNLKLVAHVLKKYKPYTDDQYQAGCMGLIVAVDNYNDSVGVPFHNFACFCIEREIHKQHRAQKTLVENIFAENMIYLNNTTVLNNGDEIDYEEIIPDVLSEEDFDRVLEEYDLSNLFSRFIIPVVTKEVPKSNNTQRKYDFEKWKELELNYILDLANIESQKSRLTLSQIAEALGISVQNVRNKHLRVINDLKKLLKESEYNVY